MKEENDHRIVDEPTCLHARSTTHEICRQRLYLPVVTFIAAFVVLVPYSFSLCLIALVLISLRPLIYEPLVKLFHMPPSIPPPAGFWSAQLAFRSAMVWSWLLRLWPVRPANLSAPEAEDYKFYVSSCYTWLALDSTGRGLTHNGG